MSRFDCDITKDLLPLYIDSICSKKSCECIEEHLKECNNCREELRKLRECPGIPVVEEDMKTYNIRVDIINGNEEVFEKKVSEGAFRAEIKSNNSFGSITCSKGDLNYDPLTNTISSVYIKN